MNWCGVRFAKRRATLIRTKSLERLQCFKALPRQTLAPVSSAQPAICVSSAPSEQNEKHGSRHAVWIKYKRWLAQKLHWKDIQRLGWWFNQITEHIQQIIIHPLKINYFHGDVLEILGAFLGGLNRVSGMKVQLSPHQQPEPHPQFLIFLIFYVKLYHPHTVMV